MSEADSTNGHPDTKYWDTRFFELHKHENELLNQRSSWFLQIQGLLFAALALSWEHRSVILSFILCSLGWVTAWSIGKAMAMHGEAVRRLKSLSDDLIEKWIGAHPITKEFSMKSGISADWTPSRNVVERNSRPWRLLPIVFCWAWPLIFLVSSISFFTHTA